MAESEATTRKNLTSGAIHQTEAESGSSSASAEPVISEQQEHARDLLKQECEQLWAELRKQQDILKACYKPCTASNEDPLVAIYGAKEKLLKAKTKVETENPPTALPSDPAIQEALLEEELKRSIAELHSTLDFLIAQHKEMKEELDREMHHEEIQHALEEKLEELMNQKEEPTGDSSILQKLKQQEAKAVAYNKKLIKQMFDFINTHFPHPSDEDLEQWNKKQKVRGLPQISQRNGVVTLKTLIENMVNQSMDQPRNPYVTLTCDHWPPYVELLVRCGIAQHHPDDDRKIRITPFHL